MKHSLFTADVIVVGGGISGTVSAIAAARQGVKVILIEKSSCLGGCATSGLLGEMNGTSIHGKNILPEIGQELIRRLLETNAGLVELEIPMTSNPAIKVDRVRYNGEYMKIILDEMANEAGVQILLNAQVADARELPDGILLDVANAYETICVKGTILIDSTGNSECIYYLGGETEIAEAEKMQAVTTMFRMGGVDIDTFLTASKDVSLIQGIITKGQAEGILPAHILAMLRVPGTSEICVNCTRCVQVNHESLLAVSDAYRELRQQIRNIVPFLIENVPGCRDAYLSNIAPALGVRDRRKTICCYELKGDDLVSCRRFEDTVASGVYPIDIHRATSAGAAVNFQAIEGNGIYKIPYSCMIPIHLDHVIVNGKGLCADDRAFGAFRTMGALTSIGTAAGTAAALAVQDNCQPREVDVAKLQGILRARGIVDI